MKRTSVILSLLALLIVFPSFAQAAPVAKFTSIEGNVDVTPPGKEAVKANLGDPLNVGDIIRTKSKAKCEITFMDGSILRLAENSRLRVTEFSQENEKRSATLDLFRGKVQNIVKAVAGQSKYEVHTPTAVCGVRGTQFYTYYQSGVSGAVVTEGTIYAYSSNKPGEVRTIGVGQAMVVTNANTPPVVKTATTKEMNQLQKDTKPAEKAKEEGKKDEEKKPEAVAAKTEEGKKEEQKPEAKAEEKPAETKAAEKPAEETSKTAETTSAPAAEKPTEEAPKIVVAAASAAQKEQSAVVDIISASVAAAPTVPSTPQTTVTTIPAPTIPTTPIVPPQSDTTSPAITVTETPVKLTNASAATFRFKTDEKVSIKFRVDEGTWVEDTAVYDTEFVVNLQTLSEKAHTFEVEAKDQAGNTSSANYSWTTDYTAPVITITPQVAPAANSKTAVKVTLTGNETVAFTSLLDGTTSIAGASLELKDLAAGSHTLKVEATDEAGNASNQSISFNLERYPLLGKFSSSIGNASGSATGELANISGQSWGGWNLDMTGSGNATPDSTWVLSAGGQNADGSYWLDTAPGTTDSTAKTLTGKSQLTYLSKDNLGVGTGSVTGQYDGLGKYSLSDVGSSYTQKPLQFLSNIAASRTSGLSAATNSHNGSYKYAGGSSYSYQYFDREQLIEGFYFPDEIWLKRRMKIDQGLYYKASITYQKGGIRTTTAYNIDPQTSTGMTETRTDSWDPTRQEWILGIAITKGAWDPQSGDPSVIPSGYTSGPNETIDAVRSISSGFTGLLGGTGSLWTATDQAPAEVTMMGSYGVPLSAPGQIWGTRITSDNYLKGNSTTYDGGAYSGYLAGSDTPAAASPGRRGLDGMAAALYIDPNGNAGYLTGRLAGNAYPDTGMFLMNGSLSRQEIKTGIGILPENLAASLWSFENADAGIPTGDYRARFSGDFNGAGHIEAPRGNLDTLSIVNYDTHAVQPWGIYKHYLAGTFANPAAGSSWSGMDGGQSAFGPYNAYRQKQGSYSYGDGGYYNYSYNDNNTGGTDYYRLNGTAYTYISTRYHGDGTKITCTDGSCVNGAWTPSTTSLSSTLPTPPDSGYVSSTTSVKALGAEDDGYWLAKATGSNGSDNRLTGTLSGRFITYTKMGGISGNILGNYDMATNTWQAVSLGTYSGKPLLYANKIEGDLYQQNKATIHSDNYQKPWVGGDPNGPFSTMRASTLYVKSQNPANLPKYGWQNVEKQVTDSKGVWSDNCDTYYPNDEYLGFSSTNNVPRMNRTQISKLSVQPDLSTSPPTMPNVWGGGAYIAPTDFVGNVLPLTTPVTVGMTQYAKTSESNYDMNVMERVLPPSSADFNQTFQGIMGAYQLDGGVSSLWSTDSTHPLGLSFLGVHQDAELPLVFRLRRFFSQNYPVSGSSPAPTPDGGAYLGVLSGALSSDRSLAAALYGLYVSPKNADGTWEAGILRTTAPLTGSSYAGINMWDAAGRIYRDPKALNLSAPSMEASHLLDLDASKNFINISFSAMGDATKQNQGLYGQFNTGGPITTLAGVGFGDTLSISGLPDFGIFEMLHGGVQNSYSNPGPTWRMDMASTGQFGRYEQSGSTVTTPKYYMDSGFWTASINDGALNSDKLSGTLNGYFLTYKKEGTLTGDFLGNLKPDTATIGIWQGASAGTWEKTRDVQFSSGIVGSNFMLNKQIRGIGPGSNNYNNYYNISLNPDGSANYAGFFSTSGSISTRTEYNQEGPPGQEEYTKIVWVQDKTSVPNVYQLQKAEKLSLQEFSNGIAALRTLYKGTSYNYSETTDNYYMDGGGSSTHDGILAGFDNLWNTGGGVKATNINLIGQYGQGHLGVDAPTIFGGTIISFDPMFNMNPYSNSGGSSKSPIGGAYYGYLGAAFGTKTVAADWMDGLINGLYRDPSGNVGLFYGKFTGINNPQIGAWTGTGTIDGGYAMGTAGIDLTEANFANKVSLGSRDWLPGVEVTVTGDSIQPRAKSSSTAAITKDLLTPSRIGFWGVWQNRTGGTYSGTPSAWSYEAKNVGIQTEYVSVQMNATESNGIKTGDVVGAGVVYDNDPSYTYVSAGTIRGLFDPVKSTFQSVAQGTIMDTTTFVNKVSSMDDAQRQAFTDATKIPAFTVGTTDLRGSGSGSVTGLGSPTINLGNQTDTSKGILNAAFYAPSTGGKPQIWASGNVTGAYTGTPTGGAVSLSGYAPGSSTANGITANFNIQQWTGTKWGASVTSGKVPAGTSGFTYPNAATTGITFQGGAAGGINATNGIFSGTAAGITK